MLLWKVVIYAMFLVKFMVGYHQSAHQINQITENLCPTYAIEVLRQQCVVVQAEYQSVGQLLKFSGEGFRAMVASRFAEGIPEPYTIWEEGATQYYGIKNDE